MDHFHAVLCWLSMVTISDVGVSGADVLGVAFFVATFVFFVVVTPFVFVEDFANIVFGLRIRAR